MEELQLQARFGEPFKPGQGGWRSARTRRLSSRAGHAGKRPDPCRRKPRGAGVRAEAELTRFAIVDGEYRAREVVDIDLGALLTGDAQQDLVLSAHDHLRIDLFPDWNSDWSVSLEGEVKFPGEYQILRGETLRQRIGNSIAR